MDGLPCKWYQAYVDDLAPRLHDLFCTTLEQDALPDSMTEALIVVLPKPGKDKLLCGSYHPISILNSDVKVLAKLLALRPQKVIFIAFAV